MSAQRTSGTSARPRRPRGPSRRTALRDAISFLLAWGIIYVEALVADTPSWPLILAALALLGVPGASEIITRVRGGTDGSDSASRSPASSSSSPGQSGDDDQ